MSVQRCTLPLTSSYGIFRFAANTSVHTPRPCPHILRYFNSGVHLQLSSKRKLQTATAYRPNSFDSIPPPPRNAGVPDTSMAGAIPEINHTHPPKLTSEYAYPSTSYRDETSSVSLPEAEAQKPRPVTQSSVSRPRTSRLRPRKAAMSLTTSAVNQLRNLLALPEPKLIRIGVKNRGCSGLAYHLEYVEKAGAFDEAVEQDGVKVLVDSKALFSIIGSEMDWVEDKLSQRFVFRNPNISLYLHHHG